MKKLLVIIMMSTILVHCNEQEVSQENISKEQLKSMILENSDFKASNIARNELTEAIRERNNKMSNNEKNLLKEIVKGHVGTVEVYYGARRTANIEVIEKLNLLYGFDLLAKQNTIAESISKMYSTFSKKGIKIERVKEIFIDLALGTEDNSKFARGSSYISCLNTGAYLYSFALMSCFRNTSGDALDWCLAEASFDNVVGQINCQIAYW